MVNHYAIRIMYQRPSVSQRNNVPRGAVNKIFKTQFMKTSILDFDIHD